tara:strand:- start:113 stop:463 length:351 start_codon:yes stop_codon:yes gene_type:complete
MFDKFNKGARRLPSKYSGALLITEATVDTASNGKAVLNVTFDNGCEERFFIMKKDSDSELSTTMHFMLTHCIGEDYRATPELWQDKKAKFKFIEKNFKACMVEKVGQYVNFFEIQK